MKSLIFNLVFAFIAYGLYKSIPTEFQFTLAYILGVIAYVITGILDDDK